MRCAELKRFAYELSALIDSADSGALPMTAFVWVPQGGHRYRIWLWSQDRQPWFALDHLNPESALRSWSPLIEIPVLDPKKLDWFLTESMVRQSQRRRAA